MFRVLSWSAAIAAFMLVVVGSWIRINGAGLTCPDWPLCHGQIVPRLDGGVLLEWSHRMLAFFESFLVAGALYCGWRSRTKIAYVGPVLAFVAATFGMQIVLGAATVALGNNPPSVVSHWAVAMVFLAGLTALAILALTRPPLSSPPRRQSGLYVLLGGCVATGFAAMCAGAYVSSSGAGLACLSFPSCDGSWLGNNAAQVAQLVHRASAGTFGVLATAAAYWAAVSAGGRVRAATFVGFGFTAVQVGLGIANVLWMLPMPLREAHAANAGVTFLTFIAAFVFATLDGTRYVPAGSRIRSAAPGSTVTSQP